MVSILGKFLIIGLHILIGFIFKYATTVVCCASQTDVVGLQIAELQNLAAWSCLNVSETDTEVGGFVLELLLVGCNIDKRVYKAAAFWRCLNTDEFEIYLSYFALSWLIMSGMLDNVPILGKKIHSPGREGFTFIIGLMLAQSRQVELYENWINSDSKFDLKKLKKTDFAVHDPAVKAIDRINVNGNLSEVAKHYSMPPMTQKKHLKKLVDHVFNWKIHVDRKISNGSLNVLQDQQEITSSDELRLDNSDFLMIFPS